MDDIARKCNKHYISINSIKIINIIRWILVFGSELGDWPADPGRNAGEGCWRDFGGGD